MITLPMTPPTIPPIAPFARPSFSKGKVDPVALVEGLVTIFVDDSVCVGIPVFTNLSKVARGTGYEAAEGFDACRALNVAFNFVALKAATWFSRVE
jgi:hypothetical protein